MPDLWPDEITTLSATPPLTILREQAHHLAKKTKGVIEGIVTTTTKSNDRGIPVFSHFFYLSVPLLDNYNYMLLSVHHDIGLYPATVAFLPTQRSSKCDNQEAFMAQLREFFSDEATRRILSALLLQANQPEEGS